MIEKPFMASSGSRIERVEFAVDRPRAMVRGLWRLAVAAIFAGPIWVSQLDWRLLWLNQRASFFGLALLLGFSGIASLLLAISSARWILFSLWPAEMKIVLGPDEIVLQLGPFGSARFDLARARIELDESVDPSLIEQMPDDAFVPCITHPQSDEDLARKIIRFARIDQETLTRHLRPYLQATNADEAHNSARSSQ